MPFVTITKPVIGEPTKKSLADTIVDDLVDLNVRVSSFASAAIANGSFEFDADGDGIPDGWTRTLYSGGSGAINTSNHVSGDQSYSFTSTVLANGGGDLLQTDFSFVAGGKDYPVEIWIKASVANVSAKAEINWYDSAQAYISATAIANLTNTPTTFTNYGTFVAAPANARYAKLKLTGGVPGAGAATGSIYFDGAVLGEIPAQSISTSMLAPSAVTQDRLKTTTASGSVSSALGLYTLTGGTFSWWTASSAALATQDGVGFGGGNPGGGSLGIARATALTFYVDERYVQSSPPYRYGPLFVTLLLDAGGNVIGSQVAPDPIWAYNGPTDITPQYYRAGKPYRRRRLLNGLPLKQALRDAALRRAYLDGSLLPTEDEIEITLAYKDSDAGTIWHPFGTVPAGATVLLVRPGTQLMGRLYDMLEDDHARSVRDLFLDSYLQIDNTTGQNLPGVPIQSYAARWKLTA